MEVELLVKENNVELARARLPAGEFVIGRDPACEIVLNSDAVSRRHARLTIAAAGVFIQDLGSANGTYVDGRRARGRVALQSGQKVELGLVLLQATWGPPPATLATPPAWPEPADLRTARRYEVGEVLAVGGMGVVRRARDPRLGRWVAMKLMSPSSVDAPLKRQRFIVEAQLTGQLEHPNIVPVYDIGIDANDQPFYTMKLVRGLNLRDVIEDIRAGKSDTIQQFPRSRLLAIFQKVCDAVAFAHSKGVLHRDLKPENIMIGDFGEVLVMDWGLALRMESPATPGPAHLDAGLPHEPAPVVGTPQFMAPEQAAGSAARLDPRADIFSLGGVLYYMLTRQPPFPGATPEESLRKIRAGILPPAEQLAEIPAALAAIVKRALAFRPEDRYPTIRELQDDLDAFLSGQPARATRARWWHRWLSAPCRRDHS